jgi:hypothetical protein
MPRDQGSGIWRATGAYARGSTFQATERAQLRVPAAVRARGLHRSLLERMKRAQGRPGDRCTRGPRAKKIAQRARDHRYRRRHSGLPCAMVLRLIGALLGEPSRLPPSPFAKLSASLKTWRQGLGAPPHDFAVRDQCRSSISTLASIASRRACRDVRETPLLPGGTEATIRLILPSDKQKYFLREALTGFLPKCSTRKSVGELT